MKNSKNQGVSLIEILIAVIVFTICITPLVAQLATTQRIGTRAESQQVSTDYTKSLAETVKQMPMTDVFTATELAEIGSSMGMATAPTCTYEFYSIKADGTDGNALSRRTLSSTSSSKEVTTMYQTIKNYNASHPTEKEALARTIVFSGVSNFNNKDFDVKVTMDTSRLATESLNGTVADPNSTNLHNLSSLDSTLTAVITDVSNYDRTAAGAYFNAVVAALENSGNDADAQLAASFKEGNPITYDDAEKEITITIDEDPSAADGYVYNVICSIKYTNPSITAYGVPASATTLNYEVLNQKFKQYPDVYLMYNQFLYKTTYGQDTINVVNNTAEEAKVYVIRTAETNAAVASIEDIAGANGGNLIPTVTTTDRDEVAGGAYINRTIMEVKNYAVEFYTNIPTTQTTFSGEESNVNSSLTDKSTKMALIVDNVFRGFGSTVLSLEEDERYSSAGRLYDVQIEVVDQRTGIKTTFDSSKGE